MPGHEISRYPLLDHGNVFITSIDVGSTDFGKRADSILLIKY
jgi:hypothetical protein